MAVQEQTPYQEITANGVTTSFVLGFECDSKDYLIVTVDGAEPPVGNWSLTGGSVVFNTAPANGALVVMQRNTPFSRTTDYQSYNNSFRPGPVNKDFDWIWLKLQELGVADWILSNRIDALKAYVDDQDDELRAYLLEEIRKQGIALDQLEDYYEYLMQRLAQIAVDGGWDASFVVDGDKNQKQINAAQALKNQQIVDISDFGGISDNSTDNKNQWTALELNKQNFIGTLAKGNYKRTPPTTIDPNLRYSYYPPYGIAGLLHLQHGTESNPERTVGQITQVVRRVNKSSRNQPYEEQIGSALFDTKIKGSGDVNAPNLGGWVSAIFNIYKDVNCSDGKLDQKGSVVGLTTFAGCDYLDEDRLVAGLWARAVSPKPSDAEYDQIAGSWHTVGAEINARVRHKDTGYRENMGKGASAVLMFYNNIRPEDIASGSTVHARNNTFGLLFGGGKFAELANTIDNYNGYYTGIQLNYIKRVGIDFPNRAGSGAIGIRFAQTRTSNGSYKTAIDLGNNKLRFGDGSFSYNETDDGDIWYNGGTLYMKDSRYNTESSRFMLANNYKIVGTNTTTPTHFITVRWNSTTNFKIPAIMESV